MMNMSVATSSPMPATHDWEFLLQKEGDRSWLPLDSPSVEILEGRYRVVARSGRPQAEVEIRVSHLATHEMPPRRRTQKRSGRTNADGLMVVTPYTVMQPGIWELSCCSDVMSDLLGQGWNHLVRLHVLPRDVEADEWDPDWQANSSQTRDEALPPPSPTQSPGPSAVPTAAAQAVPTAVAPSFPEPPLGNPLLQAANQLSQQIADDVAGEFDALVEAEADLPAASLSEATALVGEAINPPPPLTADHSPRQLQILLPQASYVVSRGGKLTLSGRIVAVEPIAGLGAVERVISLRDPQSSQILLHQRDTLSPQTLPAQFTCDLILPLELPTRLMLGEVTLHLSDRSDQHPDQPPLASQSFTVISALHELLETIADTTVTAEDALDLSDDPDNDAPRQSGDSGLNFALLNVVNTPKPEVQKTSRSIAGQVLPPQLYQPAPTPENCKKRLDLPSFAPPRPRDVPPELQPLSDPEAGQATEPTVDSSSTQEISSPGTDAGSNPDTAIAPPTATDDLPEMDLDLINWAADPASDPAATGQLQLLPQSNAPASTTYPIQDEFQALKLQDRFLDRLNALATDTELSAELKDKIPPEERLVPPTTQVEAAAPEVDQQAELLAREVVVDDPTEVASRAARFQPPALTETLPPELVLPQDEPIPLPILDLAEQTLVAGQPLTLQIKIPNLLPRIYIKLWVSDRQTRTLLEGPRWLVDFTPDGLGDQLAITELTVPFGSVEIVIAAIAVEMSTQRESHMATLNLPVLPANLPASLKLDDF
jgi:hypothetical protein